MDSDQILGLKCSKCVRFSLGGREIGGGGSSGHGGLEASTQEERFSLLFVFFVFLNLSLCSVLGLC